MLNNTVPWKLYTRRMLRMMLIVAKHFHLKRPGTDVIYKIPCYHNPNLQLGIMNRTGLERLTEVVTGAMFKPVKVKMFSLEQTHHELDLTAQCKYFGFNSLLTIVAKTALQCLSCCRWYD